MVPEHNILGVLMAVFPMDHGNVTFFQINILTLENCPDIAPRYCPDIAPRYCLV